MTQSKQQNLMQFGFGMELMKRTKVCGLCGEKADASQQFCKECGAPLPQETLYDAYKKSCRACPSCEAVVSNDAEYCPRCGGKIK